MRNLVCLGASLALLTGCVETKPAYEMSYAELRQYISVLKVRCGKEGVKLDTPEMKTCVTQEAIADNNKRLDSIQARQRMGMAIAGGFTAMGNAYNTAAAQPAPVYVPPPSPTFCTSVAQGSGMVTTNCH